MAKINIVLNNKNFEIDEAVLQDTKEYLREHFLTKMSGSGTNIEFDGTSYAIDSEELIATRGILASHLKTIAGEGLKIVIDNVEFSVDKEELEEATAELEATLKGLAPKVDLVLVEITGNGGGEASVTIDGIKYTSSTTLNVPKGAIISCDVKTKHPSKDKLAYVKLNDLNVLKGEGRYDYTIQERVIIDLYSGESQDGYYYEYGTITITEIPKGYALLTLNTSIAKMTDVIIDGKEYSTNTTLVVPIGTIITCRVQSEGKEDAYVLVNGKKVYSTQGEDTYDYTVIGDATIESGYDRDYGSQNRELFGYIKITEE